MTIAPFTKMSLLDEPHYAPPQHHFYLLEPKLAQGHGYPGKTSFFTSMHNIRVVFYISFIYLFIFLKFAWLAALKFSDNLINLDELSVCVLFSFFLM